MSASPEKASANDAETAEVVLIAQLKRIAAIATREWASQVKL
jgi:hypothetical protein